MRAMARAATGLILLALAVHTRPAQAGVLIGEWRADQIRHSEDDDEWAWARAMRKPLYQEASFPDGAKGLWLGAEPPHAVWSLPPDTPYADIKADLQRLPARHACPPPR